MATRFVRNLRSAGGFSEVFFCPCGKRARAGRRYCATCDLEHNRQAQARRKAELERLRAFYNDHKHCPTSSKI